MKEADISHIVFVKALKILIITQRTQWLLSDNVIWLCCLWGLLWAPQQREEFMGPGWALPPKMKSSSCKKRKSAPALFDYAFTCVVSVCPLEWCLSPSDLSSFAQVSLARTRCTGAQHQWGYADFFFFLKRDVFSVTDEQHRVSEIEGGGGRDKCIKNGLVPLCHFVWWGSSGVIVTLTGTMKDVSFRGRGIQNDLLEG